MAAAKLTIGYVLALPVAESVFMGGAMVTDAYGLPLEFRYTEPVRATKLQRVLYGDVLEKYIQADVIAGNLVSRLEQKPELILVFDANLLSSMDGSKQKIAWISPGRGTPLKEYGALQDGPDGEFSLQLTESGAPMRIRYQVTGAVASDVTRKSEIARILTDCGRTMDLLEPQTRVETAVKMLWEEAPETPTAG
ncbi:hypothetical protein CCAX7_64350 [Capsulimonas corticalis]|uniref:Uncharacterized protein n=1 Tax=Capsulimonas corticalis TaxID=2219043 RepID=A0A402CQQ1_9BACT|nr:hypothetical protein [Capsulimonas corticalis]BDI34384.1 hypothetical protein CCAX7_64350 [Capsulimonas corticalis]